MAETMTPAARLRQIAEYGTQLSIDLPSSAERADLLAGADALDERAQTCGTCQHANTEGMVKGWCRCVVMPPDGLMFVGPDEREKWAQKLEFQRTFPFYAQALPLDERCKGWTKREGA